MDGTHTQVDVRMTQEALSGYRMSTITTNTIIPYSREASSCILSVVRNICITSWILTEATCGHIGPVDVSFVFDHRRHVLGPYAPRYRTATRPRQLYTHS